ncbi:migration and invasion-inhibitory protein [Silurus asotus]|uniref:Migration and invasion-inhibitory protein n=1 Tax=Silurus asotus TaxID=30991 RepID=A0AAD5AU96_SILAS|nr:migration and invasion-inhibitory protein [Silurus asotus]
MQPRSSIAQDTGQSQVKFPPGDTELESVSERCVQPLLGYDWIAGLLDAENSLTERSEHFFSELQTFRQVNKDECVHSASSWTEGVYPQGKRSSDQRGIRKMCRTGWREELWNCMRKSGVSEKYVRVVQDMYKDSVTAVGTIDWFKVKVGLHQGSALSPFLFAVVMERLKDEVRQESLWTMMFADDIVICGESRDRLEEEPGEVKVRKEVRSATGSIIGFLRLLWILKLHVPFARRPKRSIHTERRSLRLSALSVRMDKHLDGSRIRDEQPRFEKLHGDQAKSRNGAFSPADHQLSCAEEKGSLRVQGVRTPALRSAFARFSSGAISDPASRRYQEKPEHDLLLSILPTVPLNADFRRNSDQTFQRNSR